MKSYAHAIALAALLVGGAAHADTEDDCLAASSASADLQAKGKLVEARATIAKCAAVACPAQIRDLCNERADRLANAIPTIVFDAKDADGNDLTDVTVTIDGVASKQPITAAFSANPGPHAFAFRAAGKAGVDRTFVLHESERGRRETIVLGRAAGEPSASKAPEVKAPETAVAQPPQSSVAPPSTNAEQPSDGSGRRVLGGTLIGVGVAGAIVSGVFTGLWAGKKSEFQSNPTQGVINDEATFSTVAVISGIAGGLAIVTGVVVFVTAPKAQPKTAITVLPAFDPHGGGLVLRGNF